MIREPLSWLARRFRWARLAFRGGMVLGERQFKLGRFEIDRLTVAASNTDHEPLLGSIMTLALGKRSGTFVDVGANVGQTLLKLVEIDPKKDYVGFEPQIAAAHCVNSFINRNDLKHHDILPVGLSDRDGITLIGFNRQTDLGASIDSHYRPADFYKQHRAIVLRKGDTILRELGIERVSFLKIDVEGAELEVLRGLNMTLRRDKPPILFEVLPNYITQSGASLPEAISSYRNAKHKELERFLRDLEYSIFQFAGDNRLVKVSEITAAEAGVAGDIRNFLATVDDKVFTSLICKVQTESGG